MNYTYLLRCSDGSLYCGWTNCLSERVKVHNQGKGAKYTRSRLPVRLVYYERYDTKEEAMRREAAIKKMDKQKKEQLIKSQNICMDIKKKKYISRILISPAKRMKTNQDGLPYKGIPVFLKETEKLLEILKTYSEPELKKLFQANEKIAHENFLRFSEMDLRSSLIPAVLAYTGLQYQAMAPQVFTKKEWDYVCRHLRILSGFYGLLKADDGVVPYRLEMRADLNIGKEKGLYHFWKDKLYQELCREEGVILNLASKEYSKTIEAYLTGKEEYVTCVFGSLSEGRVRTKATEAKMARGEMVRFLAEQGAEELEAVKWFNRLGFRFCEERSCKKEFIFIKDG